MLYCQFHLNPEPAVSTKKNVMIIPQRFILVPSASTTYWDTPVVYLQQK